MKKNFFFANILSFFLVLLLIPHSFALAASEPQAAGPSQAALQLLNTARSNAEEARKRAIDFECPEYFPGDWYAIEAQFAAAGSLPITTDAEVQYAAAAFNAAANRYNALFRRTIPLYAQAWEDKIIFARDEFLAGGLRNLFPGYLRRTDEMAVFALSLFTSGIYHGARDTAAKALQRYNVLTLASGVYLTRERIIAGGFAVYDHENFAKAENAVLAALDEMGVQNYETAITYGEAALFHYNLVYQAAMKNIKGS